MLSTAGCGRVELGQPEQYTPPPPGIDDLYREDLLAALDRALLGAQQLLADGAALDPAARDALADLAAALPVQRTALLTGAEHERELEEAEDPSADSTEQTTTAPADAPLDLTGLIAELGALRDLAAAAARQISGSLARPVIAIAARTTWSARRLSAASGQGSPVPVPTQEELVPSREVPASDPPSIGAESDFHGTLEQAQLEEWYAGYVHEVLAARTSDERREGHLALVELHRSRAEELGLVAEEDGAPVVVRQAVYAIPDGLLDAERFDQLAALTAHDLLLAHIALVGAAPFERRPLPLVAALQEAERLAGLQDRLEVMPSLEVEEAPAADG